jgi:hypothetical protein
MKYQITKTDLQINNKLHPEGSEVELTKEQTKGIENYLISLEDNKKQKLKSSEVSTKEEKKITLREDEGKSKNPALLNGNDGGKLKTKSSGLSTGVSTKVEALAKDGRGKK